MKTPRTRLIRTAITCLMAAALFFSVAPTAQAGCGCDHPPPDWAMVMPSFGSHGKVLTLYPDGFDFEVKESYEVTFRDHTGSSAVAKGYVEVPGEMKVRVPAGLTPGPVNIVVTRMLTGKDYVYDASLFTAIASAPMMPTADGVYEAANFEGAVTTDGTLLVPFNLSDVLDATQFAIQFENLALAFGAEDVLFYNSDGVDLTLFTLSVADEVEHEWGSYYGWTVEDDSNLSGRVFDNKVQLPADLLTMSDILHYWRHEFHTYYQAHLPGGSHEVTNGLHPDGTLHIDHDHLVLSISGMIRDEKHPADPKKSVPLKAGHVVFDLALAVRGAANPIEPEKMNYLLDTAERLPLEPEEPTAYDVIKSDGSLLGGSIEPVMTLH